MAYLNVNIPPTYAQIKREYLYDLKKHRGEVEDCIIFGLTLLQVALYYFTLLWKTVQYFIAYQLARLFNVDLNHPRVPSRRLDELQLWNCFSYYPSVHRWDILDGQAGKYIGKDKKWHWGRYLFTVDFAHPESNILDTDHSEIPHEHKCAHIIALDDGNFAKTT